MGVTLGEIEGRMTGRIRRWFGAGKNVESNVPAITQPVEVAGSAPAVFVPDSATVSAAVDDIEAEILAAMHKLTCELGEAGKLSAGFEHGSRNILESAGGMRVAVVSANENASALAAASQQVSDVAEKVDLSLASLRNRLDAAVSRAGEATVMLDGLAAATGEIRGIVDSIADIARQTNLLALNAAIEAARAGEAGRGFGIVAHEVKSLSVEVSEAAELIRARVDRLTEAAQGSTEIVNDALQIVREVNPIMGLIGTASQEQATTTAELSRNARETADFVNGVARRADEIDRIAQATMLESEQVRRATERGGRVVGNMLRRFKPTLRHSPFADRRRYDRFPAARRARLSLGDMDIAGEVIDLGRGGALLADAPEARRWSGASGNVTIDGLPTLPCRMTAVSDRGLHIAFTPDAVAGSDALALAMEEIERAYRPLIEHAQDFARRIGSAMETALDQGLTSESELFLTRYIAVEDSEPRQYLSPSLPALEAVLPPVLAGTLASDPRLAFAVVGDRNGYVPVHNAAFSLPPRRGEAAWNETYVRNRRIFDDRVGIGFGRSVRPFLAQRSLQDVGRGPEVFSEIGAPVRVRGRHWGGVRMAYRL
ncbi:MAG: hypothetical protein BGO20_21370 [Bosea sp. 67-29]|nr:MAG: hypothetical protein BGO20_21370 [Bosea sp. 67-29]